MRFHVPRKTSAIRALGLLLFVVSATSSLGWAQAPTPPAAQPTPVARGQREGGFVPGQQRAPEDPAVVARGKTIYEINCRSCHGPDLRGGDMGGPNLLRSPVALSDQHGEAIVPIIQGARQKMGMPAINMSPADAAAVAAYVRSVVGTIGVQGRPPSEGQTDPDIVIGNAAKGKVYFDSKCSGCHSVATDLKGLASRIPDQKTLQSTWVAGGREAEDPTLTRTPTAEVTLPSGETISGLVIHLDDFLITLKLPDGTERSISRWRTSNPKIVLHDPLERHRELLHELTDNDIHDVTAYLITLK